MRRLMTSLSQEHRHVGVRSKSRGLRRYWPWAALMRRAFDLDVLRCPRCGGRMELIATVDDPAVIHRILAHLALPSARDGPEFAAALSPPRDDQPAPPFVLPS